jgi:hypothetical protein
MKSEKRINFTKGNKDDLHFQEKYGMNIFEKLYSRNLFKFDFFIENCY